MKNKDTDKERLSKRLLQIAKDEAERQQLKLRTESLIKPKKGSDAWLDLENDRIKTIGGDILLYGISKLVKKIAGKHKTKFHLEYYEEVFKKYGFPLEDAKNYRKPRAIALFTIQFIYGRFPKEILPVLEHKNRYWRYLTRLYKHHQLLTLEGEKRLEGYIKDVISVLKETSTLHEFTVVYGSRFGLPFQLSIFDKNEI